MYNIARLEHPHKTNSMYFQWHMYVHAEVIFTKICTKLLTLAT